MATMREALEAALAPSEEPAEEVETEGTAQAETTEETTEETQGETEAPEAREEPSAEETTADDEVPTEYFGVDLSDLSPEARREVIAAYQDRDKFIQQLLRDKAAAEGSESPAEAAPGEAEAEVSDADILKALGIDPENDPFAEHTAKAALPLAKMVIELNEQVTALKAQNEVGETERYWTTSLTALEKQYGSLPDGLSHDDVLKVAAENGIAEPMDAYWRIVGPAKQAVMAEVSKRRAELEKTLKRGASGTTRPSNQADTSAKVIEADDIRDATRIALEQLSKERGGLF